MEMADVIQFLLLSILSLPCFLLLIVLTEALLRAATPLVQRQARAHFAWPPNSAFRLSAAASARQRPRKRRASESDAELKVAEYKRAASSSSSSSSSSSPEEHAECCVFCLCDVEEGEEIREIRCRHIFHRACLDTWLEHRRATCPLCRDRLGEVGDEDEEELEESAMVLVAYVHNGWWAW